MTNTPVTSTYNINFRTVYTLAADSSANSNWYL